jgi:hypothetical protein
MGSVKDGKDVDSDTETSKSMEDGKDKTKDGLRNGPRSQGGQDGGPPAGLSSPRLSSRSRNSQILTMPSLPPPQMQPQIQPQMQQPMWYYARGVSRESVKDIAAPAGKARLASATQDSINHLTDIIEKSVMSHLAEDPATTSRNCAITLLQKQEDGLTTDQKIAMISCFMEDVVAANTYILLTDPEVRQGWILMMLMK